MTTSQITALFFGHKSRATARLHQLWNEGYLEREFIPDAFQATKEAVYLPSSKGVNHLTKAFSVSRRELSWNPKSYKITNWTKQHELEVNQVKVAMILALAEHLNLWLETKGVKQGRKQHKRPDLEKIGKVIQFEKGTDYCDYVQDPENRTKRIPINPDRFMCLSFDDEDDIFGFWEIDRATMEEKRFAVKLRGYREYYFSGGFLEKHGEGGEKEDYPFRVFTTTPDERRRNRLVQVAGQIGSNYMCWFAVLDDYLNDPFGKVWVRAKEYKELISDLPQSIQDELERKHGRPTKKAQEALSEIEENVIKHSILD